MSSLKIYSFHLSGHAHKARLFASILGLDYEVHELNLKEKEHKSEEYLKKNLFGQFPILEDGDIIIPDSNAILVYLAKKYDKTGQWLPNDAILAAQVERFLTVAAGKLAYGPAKARVINLFSTGQDPEVYIDEAHSLLKVLDQHLADKEWLVGEHATIADISNYTYILLAPEGNVSLDDYKNVQTWLKRVEDIPGFIPMERSNIAK
ncbi:MAG: glutathione S-transferase [Lentisphaeraceae bacterium]|nr:glutathione S-transferase [Lentisphaeraceae bacterium]